MRKSPPAMVNIVMNAVIALILCTIANQTIFSEGSPFNSFVQEFLVMFAVITAADMIWKLVKHLINKRLKK